MAILCRSHRAFPCGGEYRELNWSSHPMTYTSTAVSGSVCTTLLLALLQCLCIGLDLDFVLRLSCFSCAGIQSGSAWFGWGWFRFTWEIQTEILVWSPKETCRECVRNLKDLEHMITFLSDGMWISSFNQKGCFLFVMMRLHGARHS